MITLTKLNDDEFILNCDLIETVEQSPDTVIALTTGKKIAVKESPRAVVQRVIDFRRRITIG
ncbi:MAG: flagellar FlbD family protein [Gracilibacteraceae bacterium]|nr:flagellar FlbD family protein [Gracilibacteraceae bacterium]MDR1322370.1 flagellar FlbD family protein [Gracilibacteraceae bacterium]